MLGYPLLSDFVSNQRDCRLLRADIADRLNFTLLSTRFCIKNVYLKMHCLAQSHHSSVKLLREVIVGRRVPVTSSSRATSTCNPPSKVVEQWALQSLCALDLSFCYLGTQKIVVSSATRPFAIE